MELLDRMQGDLREALKSGDSKRAGTIRMLQAEIYNAHIAKGKDQDFTEEEALKVLNKESKKRTEAAELYRGAGREELVKTEEEELEIIKSYLPPELSDQELEVIVNEVAAEGETNLGKMMGAVMARVAGRADSARVTALVKKFFEGSGGSN